jgi:poly-gamma-glutamate system protein
MMKSFRAKSDIVLGVLLLIATLAYIAVENSKMEVQREHYKEKMEAAKRTQAAFDYIKNYRLEKGVFIDDVNDPNETALIGQKYTLITTDRGDIDSKLSSTNPNIAAIMVQYLKDAGLEKGDYVAVGMTGSFPTINIAALAALEVLELRPIVISSVGASNFGANDPEFTWLDMESLLIQKGILKTKSYAASIGGGDDIGRGLSPMGRELILSAIERNQIKLINKGNLISNIDERMQMYNKASGNSSISAYINIGGSVASLGHSVNSNLIDPGLTIEFLAQNYPIPGVIIKMGERGIPLVNMVNIKTILRQFEMPINPTPLPETGDGNIYTEIKYNIWVVAVATLIMALLIVFIYISDKKYYKLGTDEVPLKKPVEDNRYEYANEI